jgi:hypothetical protein
VRIERTTANEMMRSRLKCGVATNDLEGTVCVFNLLAASIGKINTGHGLILDGIVDSQGSTGLHTGKINQLLGPEGPFRLANPSTGSKIVYLGVVAPPW